MSARESLYGYFVFDWSSNHYSAASQTCCFEPFAARVRSLVYYAALDALLPTMTKPQKDSFGFAEWLHSQREYQRLVGDNVLKAFPNIKFYEGDTSGEATSFGEDVKDACRHLTTIVNIMFTMAAVFAFFLYVGHYVTSDLGIRVLIALLASFVVGAAEGYFYVTYVLLVEDQPRPSKLDLTRRRGAKRATPLISSKDKQA